MYNRYIPQSDGSYRRSRVAQPEQTQVQRENPPCPPPPSPPLEPKPEPCCQEEKRCESGAGDLLRRLLPKNFDTGDLIVLLLLFLMAGENPEERNSALLTLLIYLLM